MLAPPFLLAKNFGQNNASVPTEATQPDKLKSAQDIFVTGLKLKSEGTPASLRSSIEQFQRARELLRDLGDRRREATTLNQIGLVYDTLGEKQKALESYNEALALERATADRLREATTLNNIGVLYNTLGETTKALEFCNQAVIIFHEVGDDSAEAKRAEAKLLDNVGGIYNASGGKQRALDSYNRALLLERALADRSSEASTLTNIGLVYQALGERQKELSFYEQALPLQRAANDRTGEGRTLTYMGSLYRSWGRKQDALDSYNQALLLERAAGDRSGEALTLNGFGLLYHALGETKKALDTYNQALLVEHEAGDSYGLSTTLHNMGLVYDALGEKQKALDSYNQALAVGRTVRNRADEAKTLSSIGAVYETLSQHQKALDYFNQALAIQHAVGDPSGEATTLNNIASVYEALGDKQKALNSFKEELPVAKAAGDPKILTTMINHLAQMDETAGDKKGALDLFNQVLTIERKTGDRPGEAATLNNIGTIYEGMGEQQKALDYYTQALLLWRGVGDRSGEVATIGNIASANLKSGKLAEARSQLEQALTIIESLRTKVVSEESRASYFSSTAGYYEHYVDVLMQLHRLHPAEGNDRLAFEASEKAKARSLLDLLHEARAKIYRGVDPKLVQIETAAIQELEAQAQLKTNLLNAPHTPEQLSEADRRLRDLTNQVDQIESGLRENSPRYAALTQPRPASVGEIQQQLLDSDTVLLEYALGKERSYLWLLTEQHLTSYELPPAIEIVNASRHAHSLLTARIGRRVEADKEYESAAASLSNLLLGKVAAQLGKHRLLIVADGALNYIPFAALPAPMSESQAQAPFVPLIVGHEVIQLPSASVLGQLRREAASHKSPPKLVAVFADPVFSPDDERIKRTDRPRAADSATRQGSSGASESVGAVSAVEYIQLASSASDAGVTRGGEALPRLKGSREEARAIHAFAPEKSKLALDFDANLATATSAELSRYRYVHFATHGLVDAQHPELSGLVLSLVNDHGEPVNGYLRLQEIFNLDLPADLVVLSACETGLGKEVRGEGLMGLTRGFMYAGAPRVVVSLWKVDDAATAELMTRFYEGMLKQKMRPAAALRRAQMQIRDSSLYRAPYFWAAFVLQGEWN